MALAAGTRLGPYEILSALGAGGMGEVYRARDTTLGRDVAVKILPELFVADPERVARFKREAQVLASLNHPHIGAIYGVEEADGVRALVLELVEGETLADKLARVSTVKAPQSGLPIAEALAIARQTADALDAAHERGIIHRDLKPANIKITPEGTVKVLDFGLAKASADSAPHLTHSPTMIGPTVEGALLGTAPYMSPEQARGKSVDKRTDIWAFGCVLYEMLTGCRAFRGETTSDTIAAIIERDPDWTNLPTATSAALRRLLRQCLEKDPKRRLHDIADARIDLEDGLGLSAARAEGETGTVARGEPIFGRRVAPVLTLGIVLGAAVGGLAVWTVERMPVSRAVTRSVIPLPPGTVLDTSRNALAFSPDGRTMVFAADAGAGPELYVRPINGFTATPIAGTENAHGMFFSPDGRSIGFWQNNQIKKVALSGGAPQVVRDNTGLLSAVWSDDDLIYLAENGGSGLSRVSVNGGAPQILTTPNRADREKSHRAPDVLPGSKAVIMTVGTADITSFDDARIELLTLDTGKRRVLIQGGMNARYVSTGHLVYARAGSLLAVPFDVKRLAVTGPPITVLQGVHTDPDSANTRFTVSSDGSLLYVPGAGGTRRAALMWVDRQGQSQLVTDVRRSFFSPKLSPDGERIAVNVDTATGEVWVYDRKRTTFTRLVYGWDNTSPIWSPDGTQVTFASNRAAPGRWDTFSAAADGTGAVERLTADASASQGPRSWSPDGRFLVVERAYSVQETPVTRAELWVWSVQEHKSRPLVSASASVSNGSFSPDGRWLAYESNQSGQYEVYVQAFPGPSRNWQVSTDGGTLPVWARDGRELFYRKDKQMMAVGISTRPVFTAGRPRLLFEGSYQPSYDVARDGRFLMVKSEVEPITQLNLVQNWFEELQAKVPPGR